MTSRRWWRPPSSSKEPLALLGEELDDGRQPGVTGTTPAAAENRTVRLAAARLARAEAAELRRRAAALSAATAALRARNASSRAASARLIAEGRDRIDHHIDHHREVRRTVDLVGLGDQLVNAHDPATVLLPALRALRSLAPGDTAAGALLRSGHTTRIGAILGARAQAILRSELDNGEGPGTDALRSGTVVAVPDVRAASTAARRPGWCGDVAASGVRAVLALPLCGNRGRTLGALVLVSDVPVQAAPETVDAGRALAAMTSLALARVHSEESASRAIASRDLIGQAKGILMREHGIADDEAFERLKRLSQDHNVKVVSVAEQVVAAYRGHDAAAPSTA
ncbi:GAF and ANTAR domain-containing protein [Pseudonocardia sulfidoxydans]|nr:GAF and ANTAR domain-containing protein [Pseudonocardia sulfidoxydans]